MYTFKNVGNCPQKCWTWNSAVNSPNRTRDKENKIRTTEKANLTHVSDFVGPNRISDKKRLSLACADWNEWRVAVSRRTRTCRTQPCRPNIDCVYCRPRPRVTDWYIWRATLEILVNHRNAMHIQRKSRQIKKINTLCGKNMWETINLMNYNMLIEYGSTAICFCR